MTAPALLLLWIAWLAGCALWGRSSRSAGWRWLLGLVALAPAIVWVLLLASPERAGGLAAPPPPLGLDLALPMLWVLVLIPILRRRLDRPTLAANLLVGATALNAILLGTLASQPLTWILAPGSILAMGLGILVMLLVFPAGLALARLAWPARRHWDYGAWFVLWWSLLARI